MRAPRGYSLNLVMILSASLVIMLVTMLVVLTSSAQSSGDLIARKQTFFATDGMMRGVIKVSNDFLRANPSADTAALDAHFNAARQASIRPAGFTIESFSISTDGAGPGVVPNGAFQGMNASLFPIDASLKLRKTTGLASSKQDMSATIAQIGMFQFMVFIDGYGDWIPGPPQNVTGRVHANADLCLGSDADFCLSKVTSSGDLMHTRNTACRHTRDVKTPWIARDGSPDYANCDTTFGHPAGDTEWGALGLAGSSTDRQSGCTNCAASGANWATWARNEFGNNALDSDMAVPSLRLPITGVAQAQAGKNANNGVTSNGTNSRFLVDPVLPTDPGDVRSQKYAEKADLRIIDGVWYLKDPTAPSAWPGQPIWSDHPGNVSLSATAGNQPTEAGMVGARDVGQDDIRASIAGRGFPWDATPPRLFSYYETGTVGPDPAVLLDTTAASRGVISYGTLARLGTAPVSWVPGHWPADNGDVGLCGIAGEDSDAGAFRSALDRTGAAPAPIACAGNGIPVDVALLNATRSGFRDGHVEQMAAAFAGGTTTGNVPKHQKILPANFDIAAFRAALADTVNAGELGTYFCPTGGSCFMRRPFNGIVWMGLTWTDSQTGYGAGAGGTNPPLHPPHGNFADASQPPSRDDTAGAVDSDASQTQLPYPLCTESPSLIATTPPRLNLTANGSTKFLHTDCASYANDGGARPNAVRFHNAGIVAMDYDTGSIVVGEDGMSFVSNVPVYVLGEWNVRSSTAGNPAIVPGADAATATALPWVPAMVGGDQVYLLSNNWDDSRLPWDRAIAAPVATATTYNIQILAGWAESSGGEYSGGVENFPRFLENWSGIDNRIAGSLVVGFNSPYYRWPRGGLYSPPRRVWSFDTHLDTIANQPPGAPEFNVYATRAWTRR